MENLDSALLQPSSENSTPRVRLSEQGYPGLKQTAGQIYEESNIKLRFPNIIREVDEMRKDPTVGVGLHLYRMMIGRVKWDVKAPVGASEKVKERTKFIQSCMHDMEHSWPSFITSLLTCIDYGFSIHEKVYRRRLKTNGSKYNDGLIGWKKLPSRSQSTIKDWVFSDDGRDLIAVKQSLANLTNSGQFVKLLNNNPSTDIIIPRNKFLLFTVDSRNGDPSGNTPLKAAYLPWRFKKLFQEQESIGASRDLGGVPHIKMPARYMSPDASPAEKSVYEYYKNVVRNIHNNEQAGLITPSDVDPETKAEMFKFDLMNNDGGKAYDTNAIIARYTNEILIALYADLLQLGNSGGGSYALSDNKVALVEMAVDHRLREIKDVLDHDLIRQTFALNGWDDDAYPEFVYTKVNEQSLDEIGKFIQRAVSVGAVELDREMLNLVRTAIGATPYPEDTEPLEKYLPEKTSRSGDGMSKGSGNGTSDSVAGRDNSSNNTENAA